MGVQTAVSVIIGAELGGTFRGAFGTAEKQLSTLGSAIKGLNKSSENISAFKQLRNETLTSYQTWKNAEQQVAKLAQQIKATEKPSKQLSNEFRNAKKDALLAKTAYTQNRNSLAELSSTLKQAGINTKQLGKEQNQLVNAIDVLKARYTSLSNIENKRQANLAKRAAYRSQIVDVVALGTSLYGLVKPAVAFESAMADVKKVVDFDSPEEIRQMESDIKELSKTIPLSLDGLAQIVAAGGQLGVPKEKLADFAKTASQMSVAFDFPLMRQDNQWQNFLMFCRCRLSKWGLWGT